MVKVGPALITSLTGFPGMPPPMYLYRDTVTTKCVVAQLAAESFCVFHSSSIAQAFFELAITIRHNSILLF